MFVGVHVNTTLRTLLLMIKYMTGLVLITYAYSI